MSEIPNATREAIKSAIWVARQIADESERVATLTEIAAILGEALASVEKEIKDK